MKEKAATSKHEHMKCILSILTACIILFGCISGNRVAFAKHPSHNTDATALLIRGINQDNSVVIQEAVKRGADVNALGSVGGPAKRGLTALMIVAANGDTKTVSLLLNKGASVNYHGNLGFTALILAGSHKGNVDTVRLLLNNGAKINAQDDDGFTALSWAASNGKADIVRLLLERHANVNVRTANGFTALTITPNSSPEVKQMLRAAGAH